MAIIKCPECGKEVSGQANTCIHCGYPLTGDNFSKSKKVNNFKSIILICCIFVAAIVAGAFFYRSNNNEITKLEDTSSSNSTNVTIKSPIDDISDVTYENALSLLDKYSSAHYQQEMTNEIKQQLNSSYGNDFGDITMQQYYDIVFDKCTLCKDALKEIGAITNAATGAEYILEESILTYWAYRFDDASGIVLYDESGGTELFKIYCLLAGLDDEITSIVIYNDIKTRIENASTLEDFDDLHDRQTTVRELISFLPMFDN